MWQGKLVTDCFAGGGGASSGIEMALGVSPDIAVNHDAKALAMHEANHPLTKHYRNNVWAVDPSEVCGRTPVALSWFSPDCKHFSKAKGGKPVENRIRDLAWVVHVWARKVRPEIIMLENVEEFREWGPLLPSGMPCPDRRGFTFMRWANELKRLGYRVDWRELRACDFGAPTIRKRLFVIARCDGKPIKWPAPTHAKDGAGGLLPWRSAAEIIDWSVPCPSIFLTKAEARAVGAIRPLADATMARIARGVSRFVLNNPRPFLVPLTHQGDSRVYDIAEPMRTITGAHRGEAALVAAFLAQHNTDMVGHYATSPLSTIVQKGCTQAIVAAHLAQHNSADTARAGRHAGAPLSTITATGHQQALIASHLVKQRGTCRDGQPVDAPMPTLTAGGWHVGEVRTFLQAHLGVEPVVMLDGVPWSVVDIGMRMLQPRELFGAQGFAKGYKLDPMCDGEPLNKTAQIRMCGNSVPPPMAAALIRANMLGASIGAEPVAAVA